MKPITSKVKKSASPLKQTTDGRVVKKAIVNKGGFEYEAEGSGVKGGWGGGQPVPRAVSGGVAGESYKNKMESLLKSGSTYSDLAKAGHGTESGLKEMFPGYDNNSSKGGSMEIKYTPVNEPATPGTRSDVATMFEIRKYGPGGRADKRLQRQERKEGRQAEKLLKKAARNKVIDKESDDYKKQLKSAREKRYGQGPMAKEITARMSDQKQAQIQREQITQKKLPGKSTYTENFALPTQSRPGGQKVASESMQKSEDFEKELRSEIMGGSGSVLKMKSSALKMTKGNSPFKMKSYGSKKC